MHEDAIIKKFEEDFGKAGPEMNCDSTKSAGCDDCSYNIQERERYKAFLLTALSASRKEEVELFKTEIQKRANTTPPNLLLNEVVNYAYDRMAFIAKQKGV